MANAFFVKYDYYHILAVLLNIVTQIYPVSQ